MNFEQWIAFTFGLGDQKWSLAHASYPSSAENALVNCIAFFTRSKEVLDTIPRDRACEALHVIPSVDGYLGLVCYPGIAPSERLALVNAHIPLFKDSFCHDSFDDAAFMWWEHFVGARWEEGPSVGEDIGICREIIRVLGDLLALNSETYQLSALHGINEFAGLVFEDSGAEKIRGFLREGTVASHRVAEYAEQVLAGNAP